ncbi:MAG: nucleotidyltransferase [Deltaproteobacteria bacterium RIFCSPLOWO2_02_FULL_50_16]|nr:MAG: nucleotidyltransferase [Deltaproteobacteria bacterium RIFCSPHIGHO2_02_FULL_50_15]OGQ57592.1 MAG: nucleotidyltransferase [Deltaproteobacteria bacterium RIFCSPLOWO2_02_FULL_50_16]OGQ67006.1 MAG: nucleotidyltransferase [Deltaproteobacteria bacterium RIFCSPLOWO2_12_FULL_50_11]
MTKWLKDKRDKILEITRKYGARRVRVFGSLAKGMDSKNSDLDLLVEMESGRSLLDIVAIKQDLEELLGRKVDVVTEAAISKYIRQDVLKEAVNL